MTFAGLAVRVWNGTKIRRRAQDGFVNATAMCQANGKRLNNYLRCERTTAYMAALAADAGIPAQDLVDLRLGGTPTKQGTWVHPRLAVDIARWISPEFAVWMDGWFLESLQAQINHQAPVEASTGNGRVDLVLALLTEAIKVIDPSGSYKASDMEVFVSRLGPAVQSAPLRNPKLVDAPFKAIRRIRAATI